MEKSCGSLKMIIGPMFSGKSTELLHQANTYRAIGKKVLLVNHAFDKRYKEEAVVTTHDLQSASEEECVSVLKLEDLIIQHANELNTHDVVCVEELQFFEDAHQWICHLVNVMNKTVIVAGLISDYRANVFGEVQKLIAQADDIVHLKALCSVCNNGTPAVFTQRISPHKNQVAIGASEMYRAVCRKHFYEDSCEHVVSDSHSIERYADDYQIGYSYSNYEW